MVKEYLSKKSYYRHRRIVYVSKSSSNQFFGVTSFGGHEVSGTAKDIETVLNHIRFVLKHVLNIDPNKVTLITKKRKSFTYA